jgi:hypothetical protein
VRRLRRRPRRQSAARSGSLGLGRRPRLPRALPLPVRRRGRRGRGRGGSGRGARHGAVRAGPSDRFRASRRRLRAPPRLRRRPARDPALPHGGVSRGRPLPHAGSPRGGGGVLEPPATRGVHRADPAGRPGGVARPRPAGAHAAPGGPRSRPSRAGGGGRGRARAAGLALRGSGAGGREGGRPPAAPVRRDPRPAVRRADVADLRAPADRSRAISRSRADGGPKRRVRPLRLRAACAGLRLPAAGAPGPVVPLDGGRRRTSGR